jgi:iron complex transport system substrate-binding protein
MTLEFVDEIGRRVRLPPPPGRFVSLVPGLTETLFAVGAGSLLAGVSDYCNRPPEARAVRRVGGVRDPRVAEILALRPRLVFASVEENRREDVLALEAAGVAVYVADPRSVEGAFRSIRAVSAAAGFEEAGRALAASLEARARAIRRPAVPVPVLFPAWEEPLFLPGRNTYVADLLRWAGALSVAEELGEGWIRCEPEFPRRSGALAVLLPSEPHPFDEAARRRWLARRDVPACASGRVFLVDGELTNRPGPGTADGIEAVRRILAPIAS